MANPKSFAFVITDNLLNEDLMMLYLAVLPIGAFADKEVITNECVILRLRLEEVVFVMIDVGKLGSNRRARSRAKYTCRHCEYRNSRNNGRWEVGGSLGGQLGGQLVASIREINLI